MPVHNPKRVARKIGRPILAPFCRRPGRARACGCGESNEELGQRATKRLSWAANRRRMGLGRAMESIDRDGRALVPIERPYLLVSPIPHYRDADGAVWLDPLWHHDLVAHFAYLHDLIMITPARAWRADLDLVRLEFPTDTKLEIVPLPRLESTVGTLVRLPQIVAAFWRTIGRVDFVHSGIMGWPIPLGWIANPIALLRRRHLIIVVESAFWRIPAGESAGLKRRIRARLTESLGRFFVNRAGLCLFSQPAYRESLMARPGRRFGVTPATWISDDDILPEALAEKTWRGKSEADRTRLLLAARLVPEKGVRVLLAALERLGRSETPVPLQVDVIGEGPLRAECLAARESLAGVELNVLDPVPYGEPFFALLENYHGVVLPNLSDEQPRLIFDAYARGIPVLAADTDGLRPYVEDGRTGRLFPRADAAALATLLGEVARSPSALRQMGMRALVAARGVTHEQMHRERCRLLNEVFGQTSVQGV